MDQKIIQGKVSDAIRVVDEKLSKRFIHLDPKGYFIIKLDQLANELIVEHYSNDIDNLGRAINPETGKPLECKADQKRSPLNVYRGKSAKEVGIQISEGNQRYPLTKLDHAVYLGRELQRAEECLKQGKKYVQD